MKQFWVYLMSNKSRRLYTGMTSDLGARVIDYKLNGKVPKSLFARHQANDSTDCFYNQATCPPPPPPLRPFRGRTGQYRSNTIIPLFTLWLFRSSLVTIRVMKPQEQRDLFPGALEMMILQTLKRKPLHGYALAQHIKQTSDELLEIEEGSLYPALQRMLKAGWVKADWGISATNRRVRTYKLTAAGRKHVEHEVSRFERMLKGITRVLAPAK